MALTRKFLAAMGIEEDKVDEIISAHVETVNALKEEIDNAKAELDKIPSLQSEIAELKKTVNNTDKSPYKAQYEQAIADKEEIQKQFDAYKQDIADKEILASKRNAYKELLKDAGVSDKRIDTVIKVSDIAGLELDEDGKLKDADNLLEGVKKEWVDFIVTEEVKGAETPNPPSNVGGEGSSPSFASQLAQRYHSNLYGSKED